MLNKIIIWGSANHARYTIDIIEKEKKYKIECLYDPMKQESTTLYGYTVYGKKYDFVKLVSDKIIQGCIIAIGDNWTRKLMYDKIIKMLPNLKFVSTIHPSVQIGKNVIIGDGTVIMAGVIINTDAEIGKCCFLATQASIEHNSIMGDFSSISAGVVTGGCTTIGEFSALMLGVITLDHISIGKHSIVGAGSLVLKDVPSFSVVYGNPTKTIRKRKPGDKYL